MSCSLLELRIQRKLAILDVTLQVMRNSCINMLTIKFGLNLNRYILGGAKYNMPEQENETKSVKCYKFWLGWHTVLNKVLGAGMVSSDSTMCVVVTKDWVNCG